MKRSWQNVTWAIHDTIISIISMLDCNYEWNNVNLNVWCLFSHPVDSLTVTETLLTDSFRRSKPFLGRCLWMDSAELQRYRLPWQSPASHYLPASSHTHSPKHNSCGFLLLVQSGKLTKILNHVIVVLWISQCPNYGSFHVLISELNVLILAGKNATSLRLVYETISKPCWLNSKTHGGQVQKQGC